MGSDGLLKKGVLVRHLMLPSQWENTKGVLEYTSQIFDKGQILFSLMRQYTPYGRASEFPEINRKIPGRRVRTAQEYMEELGIEDGYVLTKRIIKQTIHTCFRLFGSIAR